MRLSRTVPAALASLSLLAAAPSCSSSSDEADGSTPDGGSGAGGTGGYGNGGSSLPGTGSGARLGAGGSSGQSGSAGGGFAGQTLAGLDGSVVTQLCGGAGCACSNGKDDDGDGQIDGFDTECTGPLDDDEGSFATGIPGDNQDPKWQDCFFDGNSGAGDDRCRYATGCLTGSCLRRTRTAHSRSSAATRAQT